MNIHDVKPEDIRFDRFSNSGLWFTGYNCVRVTHKPSGAVFESTESIPMWQNQNHCLNQLEKFLETWNPMKRKYIIYAMEYPQAKEIARSHGLGPHDFIHCGQGTECDPQYGLPRGFKPDLSICTLNNVATDEYNLNVAHYEWECNLFELLTDEKKQKFLDHVTNTLDGFLWCDRVWEAWNVGTMTQEDFWQANDDQDVIYQHAVSMYIMFLGMKI